MTPAGELLRDEIRRSGAIPFSRFMEIALYHPEHGYYRRERDPFGKSGDFYTAEQLQPVFGLLIRRLVRKVFTVWGGDTGTVIELGAGRKEMAPYFAEWEYIPIDAASGEWPRRERAVVFANEFFDALPVDVVEKHDGEVRTVLVECDDERFVWRLGGLAEGETREFVQRFTPDLEEGQRIEVNLAASRAIDRLTGQIGEAHLMAIDYGYTSRELIRFPQGTLMGYRKHQALEEVLEEPGERDITAHVNFTALEQHALERGWKKVTYESLAQTLLRAGEEDQFAEALGEEAGRRQQLKTLLFSMGEMFRTMMLTK